MAVVNTQFLEGIRTAYQSIFASDFDAAVGLNGWLGFASRMNSNNEIESYNWLGQVPVMQDVTDGQIQFDAPVSHNFSIKNREWQGGFEVTRAQFERDQLGLINARTPQLAQEAARQPGQLILEMLEANPDAYDGTAFFSGAHQTGDSAIVDNDITVSVTDVTAVTPAEILVAWNTVRAAMRVFQDDKGRPISITPDTIVIDPSQENSWWQAFGGGAAQVPGLRDSVVPVSASGLVSVGSHQMYVNPYSTSSAVAYAVYTRGTTRPFIFQEEQSPSLEMITDPRSEAGIIRRRFPFTAYARHAVGVAEFRHAIRITFV